MSVLTNILLTSIKTAWQSVYVPHLKNDLLRHNCI